MSMLQTGIKGLVPFFFSRDEKKTPQGDDNSGNLGRLSRSC